MKPEEHQDQSHIAPEMLDLPVRMQWAALLPVDDPQRQETEAAIHQTGAQRQWEELLRETEQTRQALSGVPLPSGMLTKLLTVPSTVPASGGSSILNRPLSEVLTPRVLLRMGQVAAAAGLVYAMVLVAMWFFGSERKIDRFATAALPFYEQPIEQLGSEHLLTGDPQQLQAWLAPRMKNMPVSVPKPDNGAQLIGGAIVQVQGVPAVLTRYRRDNATFALLEYTPASVNLPADIQSRLTDLHTTSGAHVQADTWSNVSMGCVWTLLRDCRSNSPFAYGGGY
jgi:hypothetical protein